MREKISYLVLFIVTFGVYLRCVAPGITAGDSGEFMTTAATLSLAHPPAYPLYSIVARVFLALVPWGIVLFQVNIFSALCSSVSILLLVKIARYYGLTLFSSITLALIIGFSGSLWLNSLVTEVFALNTMLFLLIFHVLQRAFNQKHHLMITLAAFLLGLGLGNHHILVMLGFPLLFLFMRTHMTWKQRMAVVLFGFIGFSVYLFLPIRSAQTPPLNWGQPTTLSKLYRVIARKDYGSLKLTIEKTPPRTLENSLRQLKRFGIQLGRELPFVILLIGFAGILWGLKENKLFFGMILFLFVFSGPFFYGLANLPFDAQSDGIMGRFFIIPSLLIALGWLKILKSFQRTGGWAALVAFLFIFSGGMAEAKAHRNMFLVQDYGNAMLKTLPPNSVLFMDGGDDAFYSLAALHYADGRRPDLELHDRGGLIYKNVYGDDFRRIPKPQKEKRRMEVEKSYLGRKDLFYATMRTDLLNDVRLYLKGFLYEAGQDHPGRIQWPLIMIRSLYPLGTSDYRSRALGPYFPYQRAVMFLQQGKMDSALLFFKRAAAMGHGISWVKANVGFIYAKLGYQYIITEQFDRAELIYQKWIEIDPAASQAYTNLGVVYEKKGRLDEARELYEYTMTTFPSAVDAVYNLGVLYWKKEEWGRVIQYFEEVLRRNPQHPKAGGFIQQAKMRMKS